MFALGFCSTYGISTFFLRRELRHHATANSLRASSRIRYESLAKPSSWHF
jgi:hypothetical protein